MKIAQMRRAKGMTQTELATLCDTSQQQIAKIEGAVVDPRLSTLRKLASALECEVPELFYTPVEFLEQIKGVMQEKDLSPRKIRLWELNELCEKEANIPSYEPLWERVELKKDTIKLKEYKK